jgi:hypothetical protein
MSLSALAALLQLGLNHVTSKKRKEKFSERYEKKPGYH